MVVERGGGGGRGRALVDGGVVSCDGRDLTRRRGDVGSGKVVVVERDVAEQW